MRAGGKTTNPNFAVNLPKGMGGSNPSGLLFPNKVLSPYQQSMNKYFEQAKTANTANAVGQGVQALGQMAGSIISYTVQMSALKSQEHMQDQAYDAAKEAIESEGVLLDDVKDIHESKLELFGDLAKAKKQQTVADARLFEAKKTQKSMKKANKAVNKAVNKALSGRRQPFYGNAR